MKKERNFKTISVIAMVLAIICVSVSYAVLSTTLKIKGTATIATQKAWGVAFTAIKNQSSSGSVSSIVAPDVSNTPNLSWSATFGAPKSNYVFTATITNQGTIPAKLAVSDLVDSEDIPTYILPSGEASDYFTYTVTLNGESINNYTSYVWAGGASKDIVVTVNFDENGILSAEQLSVLNNKTAAFILNLPFAQATDDEVRAAIANGTIFTA